MNVLSHTIVEIRERMRLILELPFTTTCVAWGYLHQATDTLDDNDDDESSDGRPRFGRRSKSLL